MKHQQIKVVALVAVSGFLLGSIATLGATDKPHHAEIPQPGREMKAECIAMLLREVPRAGWQDVAERLRDDPLTCQRAMDAKPAKLPPKGDDWLDRLDLGREMMERGP